MVGDRARAYAPVAFALIAACSGDGSSGGDEPKGRGPASGLDVAVSGLRAPARASAGHAVDVTVTVHNRGSIPASPAVMFVLSADDEIGVDDPMLDLALPRLVFDPGESIEVSRSLNLPDNLASATLHLGAIAPPLAEEETPRDNFLGRPLEIEGASCERDAYEPDDSPAEARDAELGTRRSHNFCDDDRDFVRFHADEGERFAFAVSNQEDEARVVLTVLDGDGEALDMLQLDEAGIARWTAPESGTFFAAASAAFRLLGTGPDTGYDWLVGRDLPDLVMEEAFVGGEGNTNPGAVLAPSVSLAFSSPERVGAFEVLIVLSDDDRIAATDRTLRVFSAAGPADFDAARPIAVSVPSDLAPGRYSLGAIADPEDAVEELDETNNTSAATALQVTALDCTPDSHEPNDYPETAAELPLDRPQTHDLCDDGSDWLRFDATAGTEYRILLETTRVFAFEIELFDEALEALGEPHTGSFTWTAPDDGPYLLQITTAGFPGPVGTDDEYTVTRLLPMPDLVASKLDPWAGLTSGGSAPVDVAVDNVGGADADDFALALYLSDDAMVTEDDRLLGEVAAVSVGWDGLRTMGYQMTVTLDGSVAPGDYTLGLLVDPDDRVAESDEGNNLLVMPVTVQ